MRNKTNAIIAIHICVFIAFSLRPKNLFIFKFCFIHLKNNSICHRCLYNSAISSALLLKSFVTNTNGVFPSLFTITFLNGILAYWFIRPPPGYLLINSNT